MAQSFPWFAIISATAAVGPLADNMRLRSALDADASTTVQKRTPPGTPRALPAGLAKRTRVTTPANVNATVVNEPPDAEGLDDRIEDEVDARLEQAVEARLDLELDAIVADRVEARIEERHEQRRARHRAAMEERIAEFAADRDLPPETEAHMRTVMEGAMSSIGDLFRSMHDGDIDREDMRDEMHSIREDLELALTEVLGEDEAALFQEDLRGPLGRRGPPR